MGRSRGFLFLCRALSALSPQPADREPDNSPLDQMRFWALDLSTAWLPPGFPSHLGRWKWFFISVLWSCSPAVNCSPGSERRQSEGAPRDLHPLPQWGSGAASVVRVTGSRNRLHTLKRAKPAALCAHASAEQKGLKKEKTSRSQRNA